MVVNSGKLADWLQVIANLGIVTGLVLVLMQMQQSEDLQRVQILNQYHDSYADYESGFVGERLPEIWEKSLQTPEALTLAEMRSMEAITFVPLFRWLNMYRLAEMGILEREDWESEVRNDANYYFDTPYGRAWWQRIGGDMHSSGYLPDEIYQMVNEQLSNDRYNSPLDQYQGIQQIIAASNPESGPVLSGNWEIHASVGGRIPITVNCEIAQSGNTLSGSCTPVMENPESSELSGTVSGAVAAWGYDVVFNGEPGSVAFTASTVTADGMLGTINLSGTEAPFSAIRR